MAGEQFSKCQERACHGSWFMCDAGGVGRRAEPATSSAPSLNAAAR